MDTISPQVVQDIILGIADVDVYYPAVRTDASGDLYVSMTRSSGTINPEFVIAGRRPTDALGSLSSSTRVRMGDVPYGALAEPRRWGDYFAVAIDPSNPDCAWLVGEYGRPGQISDEWGTFVSGASYGERCDPDLDSWSDGAEATIGTNPLLRCGTNAWPPDFNDDTAVTGVELSVIAGIIGTAVPPSPARRDIAPDPPDGAITGADLSSVGGRIGTVCTP